jgi:hypothetical protein
MKTTLLYFLLLGLASQSCIVNKPYSNEPVVINSANKTYMIAQAHYKRKSSALGVAVQVGATAAGAAAGVSMQPTTFFDANNKPATSQVLNVVIGATVGYGISSIINVLQGQGKIRNIDTQKQWIEKYNRKNNTDFIVYGGFANSLNVISASAEQTFRAADLEDAKIFRAAFPNSTNTNRVAEDLRGIIDRPDLLVLLDLFKDQLNTETSYNIKKSYIIQSPSLTQMIQAKFVAFPETNVDIKEYAAELVGDYEDARLYLNYFNNQSTSELNKKVFFNGLADCYHDLARCKNLKQLFAADYKMSKTDIQKADSRQRQLYLEFLFTTSEINTSQELTTFLSYTQWINFPNKSAFILDKYWKVGYNNFSNGDELVAAIKGLRYVNEYKLNSNDIQNFIDEQLAKEVASNVKVVNTNSIGNQENSSSKTNQQFNQWLENANLTSGIVKSTGEVQYVIYGTVRNSSKFSLPFRVDAIGDLKVDIDVRGTGFWTELLAQLAKYAGRQNGIANDKIVRGLDIMGKQFGIPTDALQDRNTQESFYIPSLSRYTTTNYAVVLNFGEAMQKAGVNVFDLWKVTTSKYLMNLSTAVVFDKTPLSDYRYAEQSKWQQFARNGFENSGELIDRWRGTSYDDEKWKKKWEIELENQARWAAEQRKRKDVADKYSALRADTEDFEVKVENDGENTDGSLSIFIDNDDLIFEDAKSIYVTIKAYKKDYEGQYKLYETKNHNKDTDIYQVFDEQVEQVLVTITYTTNDDKIHSGEALINKAVDGGKKWKITIND